MKISVLFRRGPPGHHRTLFGKHDLGLRGPRVIFFSFYLLMMVPMFAQETASGDAAPTAEVSPETNGDAAAPTVEEVPPEAGGEATADGTSAEETPAEETPVEEVSPESRILELDIKTSTLKELASWCRTLGLGEGGSKEDLANRLRDYFNLKHLQEEKQDEETTPSKRKTIIIESARSTEYFTLEAVDEEYARLRGDVLVTLKDGEAVHRIQAWEILYNRTRNVMSASGGVEYIKEEGDTRETYRGESITVNLDDWSSIFMDSVSERSLTSGDTVYRFSGTLITRNNEEVTILTNSEITTGGTEESYWSIGASKLWLLPGSDWAILNAVLKVGNIPVLYIPFFVYPANEIIFHPVLGTRSREGNFIQTTTYILGRPQSTSTSESSISKILGNSADKEKIREGLFLRSTNKKSIDPNDTRLSVLLDWYANMGGYLGAEAAFPRKGLLGAQTISAGMGFTRNIYFINPGSFYSPFSSYVSSSEWNTSRMFSTDVPFRYRLEAKGSLSGTYGSLNWNLPFYSDRYVNRDFLNRSEEMDWFKLIKEGTKSSEDYLSSYLGSYSLQLSGSVSPKVTVLNPYISSLSISNISSSVSFGNRDVVNTGTGGGPLPHTSPDSSFFFPDKLTILSVSASVQGKPLQIPKTTQAQQAAQTNQDQAETPEDPFKNIGVPRSPWTIPEQDKAAGISAAPYHLAPPVLSQKFELPKLGSSLFTIDYRFSPTGASELQFRSNSTNWPYREDVDWGDVSSILTALRTDGSVSFSLTDPNTSFYTTTFRVYGNAAWQDYSLMNEEAEEYDTQAERDSALRRIHAATLFTTSAASTTTIKPFFRSSVWSASTLQYTLDGLVAKSVFNNSVDDPDWDIEWGEWHRDKLTTHQIQANINASVMDKVQTLSLTSDLPPEQNTLSGNATFRVWITETSAGQKVINPFEDDRKFEPLTFTETLKFASNYQAQHRFVFDPELEEFTSMTSSLTLNKFTATFNALRAKPYELISGQGWVQPAAGTEKLNPRDLRFSYSDTFAKKGLWRDRISFSVTPASTLLFDLQRYSYSEFDFSLSFNITILKFLDFGLSMSSKNSVVMRYFQDLPFVHLPEEIQGEKNVFVDLFNSFQIGNEEVLKNAGFKMKSFTFSLTHYLGDWTAKLNWTIAPYLPTGERAYKFNNTVSFIVQWTPITEIKTDIYYDKEVLEIR
jgi:hypothetical protein